MVRLYRLNEDQYTALERQFQEPSVGDKTTDIQAGFQLGVQAVLKKLRIGYVIGA